MKIFKKYNKQNKRLASNNKFNHINPSFEKKYIKHIKFSVKRSSFKNNQSIEQYSKKKILNVITNSFKKNIDKFFEKFNLYQIFNNSNSKLKKIELFIVCTVKN